MPCLWSPFLPFQPLAANQGPTLTWGNLAPGPSFGAGDKRRAKKKLDQASRTKSFPKKTTKPRWNHPDKETRSFHELGLSEGILPIEFLARPNKMEIYSSHTVLISPTWTSIFSRLLPFRHSLLRHYADFRTPGLHCYGLSLGKVPTTCRLGSQGPVLRAARG